MHGRKKIDPALIDRAKREQLAARAREYAELQARVLELRKTGSGGKEAYRLTGKVLEQNPDFATAWNYRKELVLSDIANSTADAAFDIWQNELTLTEGCLRVNPKSYGAWHHRLWTIRTYAVASSTKEETLARELGLCTKLLRLDERNFHCWKYRMCIAELAGVSARETLDFTTEKINENFSNYSAWHHRSAHISLLDNPDTEVPAAAELELVQQAFYTEPEDQAAWMYHRWLLGRDLEAQSVVARARSEMQEIVLLRHAATAVPLELASANGEPLWTPVHPPSSHAFARPIRHTASASSAATGECASSALPGAAVPDSCASEAPLAVEYETEPFAPSASKETLDKEIAALEELREVEPTSKWVALELAHVLSLRAVAGSRSSIADALPFGSRAVHLLLLLQRLDPMHSEHYRDAASALALELAGRLAPTAASLRIEADPEAEMSLSLHGNRAVLTVRQPLSAAPSSAMLRLAHVEELDLRGHELRSLDGARHLLALESLLVDDNRLAGRAFSAAIRAIPSQRLSFVSACRNRIDALLEDVLSTTVRSVSLDENPLLRMEEELKRAFPATCRKTA